MERIRLTASEEMSFENVDGRTDGRRTDDGRTDGRRLPLYTISSPMSLRLRELKIYVALGIFSGKKACGQNFENEFEYEPLQRCTHLSCQNHLS